MDAESFDALDLDLVLAAAIALVFTLVHLWVERRRSAEPAAPVPAARLRTNVTVAVRGDLDLATAPALEREVLDVLAGTPSLIAVDLRGLQFIDSSGLHALIKVRDAACGSGVGFELRALSPPATRILDLTGTRDLFTIAA
jgi:anti-sigma B factor antagonist